MPPSLIFTQAPMRKKAAGDTVPPKPAAPATAASTAAAADPPQAEGDATTRSVVGAPATLPPVATKPAASAADPENVPTSPLSPARAAAARTARRWKAAFNHVLHPTTHRERAACAAVWITVVLIAMVVFVFVVPPLLQKVIVPLMETIKAWPTAGSVSLCFFAIALLPLIFLPFRPFIWVAAYVVGGGPAFALVMAASTLTMAVGFGIARGTGLHARCERAFGHYTWFETMLLAVKEAKPWRVVLLLRLSPIPYTVFNYAAALSPDVKFWPYLAASIVGHAPDNAVHVFVGQGVASLVSLLSRKARPNPGSIAAIAIPFVAAIVVVIASVIYGKRALAQVRAQADQARAHALERARASGMEEVALDGDEGAVDVEAGGGAATNGAAAADGGAKE